MAINTVAFVDGFNLYHAICDLRDDHLKWVDLRKLALEFAPKSDHELSRVLYFSAYATWLKAAWARHRAYTKGLEASGVEVVMSKFKKKKKECRDCGNRYTAHEEKETDVSIGVHLVDLAYQNAFDKALLISGDSDLRPAIRVVRERFPEKVIQILTPPARNSTKGLVDISGQEATRIRRIHIERCLLPEEILSESGALVVRRPREYAPHAS